MDLKQILLFSVFCVFSSASYGQGIDTTYGKPVIVLTERDPWAMVIGSDVPSFALYEKGQIIYRILRSKRYIFYETKLSQPELQSVIKSLAITDEIHKLPNFITASYSTDQPTNELVLNFDSTKIIRVYCDLSNNSEDRSNVPKQFLTVYDNIKNFKGKSVKKWLPNKIEVLFWDYGHAPNKRPWLHGFPDLNSPTTIARHDSMYSVYIDRDDFDEFKAYYSSMGEKEAVEINGRKMSIAHRLPFPNLR